LSKLIKQLKCKKDEVYIIQNMSGLNSNIYLIKKGRAGLFEDSPALIILQRECFG